MQNKNALTAPVSLACLKIRSRNEEAINCTRNRIYSLKGSLLACENIRFSSVFAAGDVSRETFPAAKGEKKRMFSQASIYFLLYRRRNSLFVSELISYVC